ncbi:MAG: site-2 protease family protein [Solidesulfovibrio sp.]|uniref:site-2 protease family protein n=1 Tax=Solidesulfovibrio sp. TaxID=2910990 RepID=UPI002B1EAC11|nr:site-2 protease family protein [Solidesulfovibrio sp.]MEA4857287.1 site-2 protease family protein [Solidesulfovibrio sp.]
MFPEFSQTMQEIALLVVPVLMAVTFHEAAHGYVANWLGDPTARLAGRLTLNPLSHLDVIGTLAFLLTRMIGWAKPVPVDPRYFRDPVKGMMLVALAGPAMNFILAVLFSLAVRGIEYAGRGVVEGTLAYSVLEPLLYMCAAGVTVNIALGVFNLLPVPPLDGSNVLAGFLPPHLAMRYQAFGRWGFLLLLVLAVAGVLGKLILPPVSFLSRLLL